VETECQSDIVDRNRHESFPPLCFSTCGGDTAWFPNQQCFYPYRVAFIILVEYKLINTAGANRSLSQQQLLLRLFLSSFVVIVYSFFQLRMGTNQKGTCQRYTKNWYWFAAMLLHVTLYMQCKKGAEANISRLKTTQLFICSVWVKHGPMWLTDYYSAVWSGPHSQFVNTCYCGYNLCAVFFYPWLLVGKNHLRPQYVWKLALDICSLSLFKPVTRFSSGTMIKIG